MMPPGRSALRLRMASHWRGGKRVYVGAQCRRPGESSPLAGRSLAARRNAGRGRRTPRADPTKRTNETMGTKTPPLVFFALQRDREIWSRVSRCGGRHWRDETDDAAACRRQPSALDSPSDAAPSAESGATPRTESSMVLRYCLSHAALRTPPSSPCSEERAVASPPPLSPAGAAAAQPFLFVRRLTSMSRTSPSCSLYSPLFAPRASAVRPARSHASMTR